MTLRNTVPCLERRIFPELDTSVSDHGIFVLFVNFVKNMNSNVSILASSLLLHSIFQVRLIHH